MNQWKRFAAGYICLFLLVGGLAAQLLTPDQAVSVSERRYLAQAPVPEVQTLLSGELMEETETWLQDQFPLRDGLRRVKAWVWYYVLRMKDNRGVYVADGYVGKLNYPLRPASAERFAAKIMTLKQSFFDDARVCLAVIPEKNYYLAGANGYPDLDYEQMWEILKRNLDGVSLLDLSDLLEPSDYYRTDIHWRQEKIADVAQRLMAWTGAEDVDFSDMEAHTVSGFYGSYCQQAALPVKPEEMIYLTGEATDQATVWHLETDSETPVYDLEKLTDPKSMDYYDIYLSGADALQVITNPLAQTDRELIVFRDSFASSLIPLMLKSYARITLIDLRYISSGLLDRYVDFEGTSGERPEVIFLYNTQLINQSSMLK